LFILFLNNIIINFSFYKPVFYPLVIIFLTIVALLLYTSLSKSILNELFKSDEQIQNSIKQTIHELNTPVSTIKLNTKMLLKEEKNNKSIEQLNRINKSCNNLLELYNDMEYIIKKEVHGIELQNICLDELIIKTIDKYDDIKEKINIQYTKTNLNIISDKKGLQTVIDNLVSNAIKYNKKNGKISIYTKDNSLYIDDTGIGIDVKNIFKVFDKYYQENNTNVGFGMGLYRVKTFCDNNNIKLNIHSKMDISTSIVLTFK